MRNSTLRVERSETAQPVRDVMDIRQAAEYLGISTDSLYRYAAEGMLPGFRLGNRWRFRKSRLEQWMDEQSERKAEAPRKKPVRAAQ
jgi:excisionase family DNA binding protein